jgi:diketogulonate reductase-like aldo/keto reductase
MQHITWRGGESVPALGLGTWRLGESAAVRKAEVGALRLALDLGYRVIDTAEMYGDGGAEEVLGEALQDAAAVRDTLFIVSKVYPHNASRSGAVAACERSLRRLGIDRLDLYLLHWPGSHPLGETVAGFEALQQRGLIRHWGVSNFDLDEMQQLAQTPGGAACSTNQVYYSLGQRGIEHSLLPWQRAQHMPVMAYSPIDQGALASHRALQPIAQRHGATAAQIALAWVLHRPGVLAIPKAAREQHLRENLAAAELVLDQEDLAALDRLFPPPGGRGPLAMI